MERCENCMFYAMGECVINKMKISIPEITVCDDWELSHKHIVEEFDETFKEMWEFFELESYKDNE